MLLVDRSKLSLGSAVTNNTLRASYFANNSTPSLVLPLAVSNSETTTNLSLRYNSDRIVFNAARYIFVFTFLVKSRGAAANVLPPPTQIGLRIVPARARPVPFCFQGFTPPPLTAARFFCALVPERPVAK